MAIGTSDGNGARVPASVGASRLSAPYDWACFFVGLALTIAPLFLSAPDTGGIGSGNLIIMGLLVMAFVLCARAGRGERWHWRVMVANIGLWLALEPIVWGYVDISYRLVSLVGGVLLLLLMIRPVMGSWRAAEADRNAARAGLAQSGPGNR
jgi:hypothetical protein